MRENKAESRSIRFVRRDMLKAMTAVPAAALASVIPATSKAAAEPFQESAPGTTAAAYQPVVFSPHEWKTVHVLCDYIIPADDVSDGASQAGVPEFIDDWLNLQQGNLIAEIRGGLTWLDVESNRLFDHDFVDSTPPQQKQLLDRIAFPKKAAPNDAAAVSFFNNFRDLVASGFFTSAVGLKDLPYLGNEPQEEWHGCPPTVLAKLDLDKKESA